MYVLSIAANVSAGAACTGGQVVAYTVSAVMITGQRWSHTTRLIQISRHGLPGATGISRENRRTGAEAGYFIRSITAQGLQNIKAAR